jgi:hypothetical protein
VPSRQPRPPLDGDLELSVEVDGDQLRVLDDELRIAVDFDGVLFDQSRHVREVFQEVHDLDPGPAEDWPWRLTDHPPIREAGLDSNDTWTVFDAVHNDTDRHREPPLDPRTVDVLGRLREAGHTVEIVTARDPASREPTEFFLDRNDIPHDRLVMGDNTKTGWDVLLDDLPPHVERVAQDGALGLLHDQPYNRAYETDGNPRRVAGFHELEAMLLAER